MKHTTEELLLAAKVRSLAISLRSGSTPEELEGVALSEWRAANPVANWLIPALKDLEFVAGVIKNHQA